ncbi:glycosyl hydrolase superfamily protein [Striga asiatica]|uniref:Glycosyl hydrolase superfamily protein n=1 Tax=Striga asiatica TaxID=4170 RepID=A0A5A7PK78_STRAF|nr:glycosyl hydrolase superfamily protein [Striga asiatica]
MEKKMGGITAEAIILVIFLEIFSFSNSAPLFTSSRWIVDRATGDRVKFACANWVSHLQPMIAEGLEKKPLAQIARQIAGNGFNCVRFTWATYAFTRPDYSGLTVSQSLDKYNLTAAKAGLAANNPWAMGLKVVELHRAVVNELGKNNLMVVLDNHVSLPDWCCGPDDGNGFFGDPNFDASEWLQGLAAVARTYKGNPAVVGMSMRNELRGSRQNEADWYKYMQAGANTIHTENPDFLVIVSGLSFDTNLGFLKTKPLDVKFDNKLVFEAHWYTFGIPDDQWTSQTNNLCASVTKTARDNHLFLTSGENPFPLFLSEFGIDQRGQNEADNRYISCLLAEVAEKDLDWALWTFQGSYILRQGTRNLEEVYGIMDLNWDRSNSARPTSYIMFHPQSGQCVQIGNTNNVLLANCKAASRWDQLKDGGPIKMAGNPRCLVAGPVTIEVSNDCSSKWKFVSSSGLHLAAQKGQGSYLCLDGSNTTLVGNKCLCVGDDLVDLPTCADNPQVQWFKFVPTNTKSIFLFLFLQISAFCNSVHLSTSSRWIVDQATGKRVKLACANWASHLEPMIAEGLEKKPLRDIARQIASDGFNCVRFTWATFMFTRPDYSNLSVSQSLDKYSLAAAKAGIAENNPQFLNVTITELHRAVVKELGRNNLMVVLDNHVSEPKWCCGPDDGNGFFGDPSFDPLEWLKGLSEVARIYKRSSAVVGMSMRNELRGNRQNEADWYKFMQDGANTIHKESPDFLIIVSGLSYDTNLGFLKAKPLGISPKNKLVYEAHWYTFGSSNDKWTDQTNGKCASITKAARDNFLFLTTGDNNSDPSPLFLSEFGIDQSGVNEAENRYVSCLLAEVAEKDVDWALWAFQGSYMLRQGTVDLNETYGVTSFDWERPRNPNFLDRLQFIRQINQDPNSKKPTKYVIFHPQSGQCVQIGKDDNSLLLANCKSSDRWDQHRDGGPIKLAGKSRWLTAEGEGGAASLSNNCSTNWKLVSSSGLHLAAEIGGGNYVCLEKNGSGPTVVTNKCLCVGDDLADLPTCNDNPQVQWFKLVAVNV